MKTKFTTALGMFYLAFSKTNSLNHDALYHYEKVLIEFNKQLFDAIIQREFAMALAKGDKINVHTSNSIGPIGTSTFYPFQAGDSLKDNPDLSIATKGFSIEHRIKPITERTLVESEIYKLIGVYCGIDSINYKLMPKLSGLIAKRNELEKIEVLGELNEIQPAS